MQAWIWLIVAILFEVAGTTTMKLSEGFSKLAPSIAMAIFYLLSLGALTMALFGEVLGALKIVSILLIVLGVVGLHLSS